MRKILGLAVIPLALAACSSESSDSTTATTAKTTTAVRADAKSEDALKTRAHDLDVAAAQRQDEKAWGYYSQRCQAQIGDLHTYSIMLNEFFRGRNPDYTGVTVKVNGSSAQVVSTDNDPAAPASGMYPRTWTFIDGQWMFDNC